MCCVFTVLVFLGPRVALIFLYLLERVRFEAAISSFLVSCLGFIFLPWTLLAYVLAYNPVAGVTGFGWVIVGLGLLLDLGSWFGGGYGNRRRFGYTR